MRKIGSAIALIVTASLFSQVIPANAVVTETTLTGTISGNPATQLAKNDVLSVKAQAPISLVGPATQTVTTTWAPQGLQLDNLNDITYPEGWDLEYTEDGEVWSDATPGDSTAVVGVRASGHVDSLSQGVFQSFAAGEFEKTSGASGAGGGGDGYNVAFGNGTLVNAYHHSSTLTMACHLITGEKCGAADASYQVSSSAYNTTYGSNVFYNKTTDLAYIFVSRDSDNSYGIACVDYSDIDNADFCATPFTQLATGGGSQHYMGNSTREGDKLWTIDGYNGKLMCFDMTLNSGQGGACADDNGFALGTQENGQLNSRVTAVAGKVFFIYNDKLGCYDPATHGLCGGNAAISVTTTNRHAPIPVENADGTFYGACAMTGNKCLTTSGVEASVPAAFATYWTTHDPAIATYGYYNMADFSYVNHRLYYIGGTTDVTCYNFTTQAACAGFDGLHPASALIYTANVDPDNPDCVWINQDYSGDLVPLDAYDGTVGCSLGAGSVVIPFTAEVTRMACDSAEEVLTWNEISVTLPEGITPADFTYTLRDSDGNDLVGFVEQTLPEDGIIDISALDPDDSGLDPELSLVPLGDVTGQDLLEATAGVTFSAAEPEVCVDLTAVANCPDSTPDPASPDVPDGLVSSSSVTVPDGGGSNVSSEDELEVTGTNTGSMCKAVLPGVPTNPLTVYFTSISPKLLSAGQRDIQRLLNANTFTSVKCVGYTQGSKLITWLAKQRAANVCAYAKSINRRLKTKTSVTKVTGPAYTYRSVILTGS